MVIYSLLEVGKLLGGQGVSLADDGDDVDSGAEALHQLNVDFSEAGTEEQKRKKRTDARIKGPGTRIRTRRLAKHRKEILRALFFCAIE